MPFPVHYFQKDGRPVEGAACSSEVYDADALREAGLEAETLRRAIVHLNAHGLAVSRIYDPYGGQVARVQIDAYGESAAEVESTLLTYSERAGAALQASECSYGRCVIERNLEEQWGDTFSWRGRLVLHPTIGVEGSTQRKRADEERLRDGIADSLVTR